MKIETKTYKQGVGSGGWIEGYESIKVRRCVVQSKTHGCRVRIPLEDVKKAGGSITAALLREHINSWYPPDYRRKFAGSNQFLIEEFDLNNPENKLPDGI